jgi:hypothetical protein
MKQINKTLIILAILASAINWSCEKSIVPNEKNGSIDEQKKLRASDMLSNQIVIDWSNTAFEAVGGAAEPHALLASRSHAMMHIAIHDALNAIVPLYEQYTYHGQSTGADPFAATASAAATVLKALWPANAPMIDTKLAESLAGIADGPAKTMGIETGMASAQAILDLRAGDGAYQDPIGIIPVSTVPGVYNTVPPFTFAFAPFWKDMQPFSLESPDQFRSSPPPALTSPTYARDFNEIKAVGSLNSTTRTADQSAYAKWWYELSDIGWNRIARIKAAEFDRGLFMTARMFALLNMALADGYIAGWDSKYFYNFWRPYTAIRAADTDGNDATVADPNWEPAEPTPPVPDYPSTHSALGSAAATVLSYFYGNHSPFSMTSTTAVPAGAIRSFKSFKEAADENADSRVMAGIHFRFACDAGQKQGEKVGKWTVQNHLEPLH